MVSSPNRTLAIILSGVAVLVAVAATVAALRPVPSFDPASPEGAVQSYLEAVLAGDEEAAAAFLSPDGDCDVDDVARADFNDSLRVALIESGIDGDEASIEVEITYGGGGPFESEYGESETFELERRSGSWVITGQPWPMYFCEGDR